MTTYPSAQPVQPARLSKSALSSFICGLLGCIPFVTGVLAVLLGIVGFIRTGDPLKRGRWMAVVGILLGILSVSLWTVFGGGALAAWGALKAPGVATHEFIHDLAAGDMTGAKSHSAGLSEADLRTLADSVTAHGTFVDTTFNNVSIKNSDATVDGSTAFNTGSVTTHARLTYTGGSWKVTDLTFPPP
jgi:multisubunit Na+/H+ antiporter MnhG subunit